MYELFLITGFLGSGKTTLLQNLLLWPGELKNTAILVNEFGEMGTDGALLEDGIVPIVELSNGCICCSMKHDLNTALTELHAKHHPERIIVEATGLANPLEVIENLSYQKAAIKHYIFKIITVVSADLWESRKNFGPIFVNQIEAADLILFNKIDLIPPQNISGFLDEIWGINSLCPIRATNHCQVDPNLLWQVGNRPDKTSDGPLIPLYEEAMHFNKTEFSSFSFINDAPFRRRCFHRFLDTLPDKLHRIKGFAQLDDEHFLFNYSHGQSDWTPMEESQRATRLTFIGKNMNKEHILAGLQSCLKGVCDG